MFIYIFIAIITLVGVNGNDCAKSGSSLSPVVILKKHILCNYAKETRPIKDETKAITVTIRFVLKSISLSSFGESEMSINNWMGITWKDEYLTWKPEEYNSLRFIHISSDDIWTPDLGIHKLKDVKLIDSDECILYNNGIVTCTIENTNYAKCKSNFQDWPYDTQICQIKYGTETYNESKVRLKMAKTVFGELGGYAKNSQWKLRNITIKTEPFEDNNQTYQLLSYDFKVDRYATRIESSYFIPVISLIIMTLAPLWLCFGTGERLCLTCSNILSHFLYLQQTTWLVPNSGPNLPKIVTYFQLSLCLAVCVLVELIFLKTILSKRTKTPIWILGTCKLISNSALGKKILIEDIEEPIEQETLSENKKKNESLLIVNVFDKLLFFIFFLTYFIMFISMIRF